MVDEIYDVGDCFSADYEKVLFFQIENGFSDTYNEIRGCAVHMKQEDIK